MPTAAPAQRVMRVFVSSTFRDMQAEREELVKRVFPRLRKLCEQRGVTWGEADLRWGITEEQAERGEVLPVCLAEVGRCQPFFFCLLGERYGWVPDHLSPDLLAQYPWLAGCEGRSATELEVVHGVLRHLRQAELLFADQAEDQQLQVVLEEAEALATAHDQGTLADQVKQLRERKQPRPGQ